MIFLENVSESLFYINKFSAFLVSGNKEKINPMTIGWAQFGISCGKSVLSVMVRPSRFSKALIEESGEFTLCIPHDEQYKKELAFCGTKSGRDFDKLSECGLITTPSSFIKVPGIKNCRTYECKVLYKSEMSKESLSPDAEKRWYPSGDLHTIYTGEILNLKEN